MDKLKRKILFPILSLLLALVLLSGFSTRLFAKAEAPAVKNAGLEISAKSALLMDYSSGKIVFTQNEKAHLPIASMVKIMTLLLTFEEMEKGNISEETMITASENATSMGGSQAFLDTNASYSLGELIKSIVVGSANDSCVAVGEHICGDISSFVDRMNAKAKELNMADTNFVNCTGLPAANQYSCARDVAVMTRELVRHPLFFKYSKIWMFDFAHPGGRVTQLSNTNKLIRAYEGCDGGKTGFTNEAMFCLSATAKRGNTRLISVVMGAQTSKIRNAENAKLFNYGFANFETRQLVVKGVGDNVDHGVSNGKVKTVKLVPSEDLYYFMPKNSKAEVTTSQSIDKIAAPVKSGERKGTLSVFVNGEQVGKVNLLATADIGKVTYIDIINDMIDEW